MRGGSRRVRDHLRASASSAAPARASARTPDCSGGGDEQGTLQPDVALADVASDQPVVPELGREGQRRLGHRGAAPTRAPRGGWLARGRAIASPPCLLAERSGRSRGSPARARAEEVLGMEATHGSGRARLSTAARPAYSRMVLEQRVAGRPWATSATTSEPSSEPIDQRPRSGIVAVRQTAAAASRREASGEDGEAASSARSSSVEQRVAPVDRRPQGPLPRVAPCGRHERGSGSGRRAARRSRRPRAPRRAPPRARGRAAGRRAGGRCARPRGRRVRRASSRRGRAPRSRKSRTDGDCSTSSAGASSRPERERSTGVVALSSNPSASRLVARTPSVRGTPEQPCDELGRTRPRGARSCRGRGGAQVAQVIDKPVRGGAAPFGRRARALDNGARHELRDRSAA